MGIHTVVTTHKWKLDGLDQRFSGIKRYDSIFSDIFLLNGKSKAKFSIKLERRESDLFYFYLICNNFGRSQDLRLNANSWFENLAGKVQSKQAIDLVLSEAEEIVYLTTQYKSTIMSFATNDILFICCEIKHEELINEFDESEELDAHEEIG